MESLGFEKLRKKGLSRDLLLVQQGSEGTEEAGQQENPSLKQFIKLWTKTFICQRVGNGCPRGSPKASPDKPSGLCSSALLVIHVCEKSLCMEI